MKLRVAALALFALCLAALPAFADTIYSNGPINGTTDAWTINFGFAVSDTFTVANNFTTITGIQFGAWLFPGDVLLSAEVLIGNAEFSGSISDQTITFTQSGCSGNQYGFNVCVESGDLGTAVNLSAGTYWLTLENAVVNTGDPVYWDENSGASRASESSVGTIPSEAFTILGHPCICTTTITSTNTTPEPSSIVLFGSGVLGLIGVLGRKF